MALVKKIVFVLLLIVLLGILYLLFTSGKTQEEPQIYFPEKENVSSSSVMPDTAGSSSSAAIVASAAVSVTAVLETSSATDEGSIYDELAAKNDFLRPKKETDHVTLEEDAAKKQLADEHDPLFEILKKTTLTDEEVVRFLYKEQADEKIIDGISHEEIIQVILKQLGEADEYRAEEAAVLLFRTVREVDAEALANIVQSGGFNEFSQSMLVRVLGNLKDRRVFKTLYDEFKRSSSAKVRDAVIWSMGQLGDERALPVLLKVVNMEGKQQDMLLSPDSKALGLAALANIGTPKALKALEQGMNDLLAVDIARLYRMSIDRVRYPVDFQRIDNQFIPGQVQMEMMYKGTKYLLYIPTRRVSEANRARVMVCVHGRGYNYESVFRSCQEVAKRYQFAVLAPVLDFFTFPSYHEFNVLGQRSDQRLIELLDYLEKKAGLDTRELYFYGVGRGGEFVYNFTLIYPERVGRALIDVENINPPDAKHPFPTGIAKTPWAPDIKIDLLKFVKSDLAVLYEQERDLRSRSELANFQEHFKYAAYFGVTPRLALRKPNRGAVTDDEKETLVRKMIESYVFLGL